MKKRLLLLLATGSFVGVAHAQSSVTLYGIIDEGVNYTSNSGGSNLWNLSSGVMQGSRWGLKGQEDLGGGLNAIFVLESGFDVNNGRLGQGGLLFGRQAYVGLSSSHYGSLTLGRQYDLVVDFVGPLAAGDQWGGYIAAHPGDLDNLNNTYRTNNAIKFTSPSFAGLTFGGLYSLGGVPGSTSTNQTWSLGAGYTNGPLALGVGYLNSRTPSNAGGLFGNNTTSSTPAAITSPVYSGYASANTYQVAAAGGAYTIGSATIGATYSNVRFGNLRANGATIYRRGDTASFNNGEISLRYQLTAALLAGAAFSYTVGSNIVQTDGTATGAAKYYQGALGADYFLSKRTDVYVIGIYQQASGTDSRNERAVASINGLTPSTSNRQTTVRVGIRHKF